MTEEKMKKDDIEEAKVFVKDWLQELTMMCSSMNNREMVVPTIVDALELALVIKNIYKNGDEVVKLNRFVNTEKHNFEYIDKLDEIFGITERNEDFKPKLKKKESK